MNRFLGHSRALHLTPHASRLTPRASFAAGALLLLAFALAAPAKRPKPAPPDEHLSLILAKMKEAQQGVQTLRVAFTQTNKFAMLSKPQVLKGTLVLRKPATALYAYHSPSQLYFRVMDGSLLVFNPSAKEATVQDIRRHEARIARYLGISQPIEELRKNFEVTKLSESDGLARLTLVPTKVRVKRKIAAMHFTVNGADGMVRQFDIVEAEGDQISVAFQNGEINPVLGEKDFEVQIPKGVKIKRQMLDLREPFGR